AEGGDAAQAFEESVCDPEVVLGRLSDPDPTVDGKLVWAIIIRSRGIRERFGGPVPASNAPVQPTHDTTLEEYQTAIVVDAESGAVLYTLTSPLPADGS
ncbi:MAG TPA: hypothetical protein VGB64_06825, partial [Actinomycetota bacterium]